MIWDYDWTLQLRFGKTIEEKEKSELWEVSGLDKTDTEWI